jgi:hypothetical protein
MRIQPGNPEQVLGPLEAVALAEIGSAERRRVEAEEEMLPEAGPWPRPHPHRDVDLVAGEIGERVRGEKAYRELGPGDLEAAEARRQPVRGEGLGGADAEHALILVDQAGKALGEPVEGVGDDRRQPPSGLAQRHPPLRADEQRHSEPLLEQSDLVAYGRLGHPQLACREGEILVACGSLEHPDGGQRRKVSHRRR